MYAMDTAVHFEHRNDTRRTRWDLRRSARTVTTTSATSTTSTPVSIVPTNGAESPVHEFLD